MSRWETVIGLECHVQLRTASKLFSRASASFGGVPNSHTDPYTLALPGTLPVPNRRAVELAVTLALAVGCTIRRKSIFARKHYFYPDLPKGYQISQYDQPFAEGGAVEFELAGERRSVRLERIHMEEDAGKSMHTGGVSHVDLNRAGVPLVEVVSRPDLRSAEEAAEYLRALRGLVRWLGASDGNMEEGSLRCDANVSVRPVGEARLGTRTELKNINSFKFVQKAIEFEAARQIAVLEAGGHIVQETRLFDSERGTTHPLRSKEEANDYRYFPEPDLPPLVLDEAWVGALRARLPELPRACQARFVGMGVGAGEAALLASEREIARYFDEAVAAGAEARTAATWIASELLARLHRDGRPIADSPVAAPALAELLRLLSDKIISGKIAKDVLDRMWTEPGASPKAIVERAGLVQLTDEAALEAACRKVIDAHHAQAEKYRGGQAKLLGFFVGQVMRETGGKANPEAVNRILKKLLG